MRAVILMLLLTAASDIAVADWEPVASGANATGYVDRSSIRKSADSVTMQVLIDYQKPPFDGNNLPYLSLTMRNEYHCAEQRFRVLTINSHTEHMGQGEQPYKTNEPSEWEPVPTTSIQKMMWSIACEKSVAPQAHTRASARL